MSSYSRHLWLGAIIGLYGAVGCSGDDDGDDANGDGDGDTSNRASGGAVIIGGENYGSGGVPDTPLDPCFGDLTYCATGCSDLTTDPLNCGDCGNKCEANEMCAEEECVPDPSAGGQGGQGGSSAE